MKHFQDTFVLVDLDGVLIDSMKTVYQAYRKAFAAVLGGNRELPFEVWETCFWHRSYTDGFRELVKYEPEIAGKHAQLRQERLNNESLVFDSCPVNVALINWLNAYIALGSECYIVTACSSTAALAKKKRLCVFGLLPEIMILAGCDKRSRSFYQLDFIGWLRKRKSHGILVDDDQGNIEAAIENGLEGIWHVFSEDTPIVPT